MNAQVVKMPVPGGEWGFAVLHLQYKYNSGLSRDAQTGNVTLWRDGKITLLAVQSSQPSMWGSLKARGLVPTFEPITFR